MGMKPLQKANPRTTSQGYVDLKKKTIPEIKELIERQDKLLSNRSFISKLPDKGEKIQLFKTQLSEELKRRDIVDEAAMLMSQMNLNQLPTEIEWNNTKLKSNALDSDDDSDSGVDPLKIVATHSGTMTSIIKKNKTSSREDYSVKLCEKFDHNLKPNERFKPNEPKNKELARTGYKESAKKVKERLGKNWDVTAAITPVPVFGDVKLISLADSLRIQREQADKVKEIQLKEAREKLKSSAETSGLKMPLKNINEYREPKLEVEFEGSCSKSEEHEESGDSDSERGGAVFYNLIDEEPAA